MDEIVNISEVIGGVSELVVLKILACLLCASPAEICAFMEQCGIVGLSPVNTHKVLTRLLVAGYIEKDMGYQYFLTEKGRNFAEKLFHVVECFVAKLSAFKEGVPSERLGHNDVPVKKQSIYDSCCGVKFIPYVVERLDRAEDEFFLHFLEHENGSVYEFDSRGLGLGDFSDFLVAFQTGSEVRFVAVIDYYADETKTGGKKFMKLRKKTVCKFEIPISASEIRNAVDDKYRVIRNKVTFTDPKRVRLFIDLVKKHL